MTDIKIIIADDHPFFRDGIRQLLADQGGITMIDEATNGREVLRMLDEREYDLVVMDIKMPEMGGIDATKEIKKKHPQVKVLAMSMYDEQPYIIKMMKAGAKGYLLKNSSKEEMLQAVRQLIKGESYFSKEVSGIMITQIISGKAIENGDDGSAPFSLTNRELEIVRMIAGELTNVEIGERLHISPRTVDTHRRNLFQKLKIKNTAGLVKYAIRKGLLD